MGAFDFIGPGHPFFGQIEQLRAAVGSEAPKAGASARSLLRIDFAPAQPALKWAYVSKQRRGERFEAVTFLFRAQRNRVERYDFPRDPKLGRLDETLREFHAELEMLRYVPRRRFTARLEDRIAKVVRAEEAPTVLARLQQVEEILKGSAFAIPRIVETRAEGGVFFETVVEGRGIDTLLDRGNRPGRLEGAARVLREIHRCKTSAANLPRLEPTAILETARKDAALVALFRPDLKEWLAAVWKGLAAEAGGIEAEMAFCHGDFRASHLLARADGTWGVVDFDGATLADSHWELALFATSLKRECPIFIGADLHEDAVDDLMRGYGREGGVVKAGKWRWFRLAAEIHFLARSFQRDLYAQDLFEQSARAIGRLSEAGPP